MYDLLIELSDIDVYSNDEVYVEIGNPVKHRPNPVSGLPPDAFALKHMVESAPFSKLDHKQISEKI